MKVFIKSISDDIDHEFSILCYDSVNLKNLQQV